MNEKYIKSSDFKDIDLYFSNLKYKSKNIYDLFSAINKLGDPILVGGAIREILIKKSEPRDIDIIIDTQQDIGKVLDLYENCYRNRFGGYKIKLDNIEFDIWSIDNHWAFKEKIVPQSILNLKETTFLNFDSLFYNLNAKNKEYSLFNQCLRNRELDITLQEEYIELNPTAEINILRMLFIKEEWELDFSEKCKEYINKWIFNNELCVNKLYTSQFKHYKYEKATEEKIKSMIIEYS